ncbi:hypothetical protein [Phytoactinopolyspora halotolerans]|uniref:DUF4157 domain-containing protein n=1 Tax=Phytoactinopolyspora halotolerans TaxID=1981512 RepID=A0A6L9SAL9_9ACTN|nr:hypothetical protein [Phytoactinopolyspora halotolerans]NEE01538.1 hypothetical protein [Phytoactinopolyspora halotolerans]
MPTRYRLRQIVNWVNLSTLLGLLIGVVGRSRFSHGDDGLILGRGYRFPLPPAPAFTVGNVVLLRIDDARLARRPRLLAHEARHATQYAWCLGPVMLVLYLLAAAWSWLLTGHIAARNPFERHAGLADGGYRERPLRPSLRRS